MSNRTINELARAQILALTRDALNRSGALGTLPTPLDEVARVAGICQMIDISELPVELRRHKPWVLRRILGAIFFKERTVFIDRSQPEPRVRFTKAHEAGHGIIPWHAASYHLDDESRLSPDTREQLEVEANLAAAHLLFQGPNFHRRALDYQVSIAAPLALADDHGASAHAAIRYYVEHHPDAVALLMLGRYVYADGTYPLWGSVESPSFLQRFGHLVDRFPERRVDYRDGDGRPFGDILKASRIDTTPSKRLDVVDLRGDRKPFVAEAFFNGWTSMIMLSEPSTRRFGRRLGVYPEPLAATG